ncbi:hypothetical protein AAFN60_07765 [Roseibacillus persicicus]|uniref:hypothetical protein n=1 Tax=Roseibacillus persicicus TaxID=454148 RepID=UPI00398B3C8F
MKYLKICFLAGLLFSNFSAAQDFSFLDKAGYSFKTIEIESEYEKTHVRVFTSGKNIPIIAEGFVQDGEITTEFFLCFSDSVPTFFHFKKWKSISHPTLSAKKEGELSQFLLKVQNGEFGKLENEVVDSRLWKFFQTVAKKIQQEIPLVKNPDSKAK